MRTKDTLLDDFDRVRILLQYLYLSEDHSIEVFNGVTTLRIRMTDNCGFKGLNLSFPDLPEMDYTDMMTVPQMIGITYALEKQPKTMGDGYPFKNRWEEITEITMVQVSLNVVKRRT